MNKHFVLEFNDVKSMGGLFSSFRGKPPATTETSRITEKVTANTVSFPNTLF
jgi:hypothetical protein